MKIRQKTKSFAKKFKIARPLWHFYQAFVYKLKHPYRPYNKKDRNGVIVQLLATFTEKDAIGNATIELSKALTNKGIENYIVYEGSHSNISNGVPLSCFKFNKKDIVLYHMGIGCNTSITFKNIKVKKKIMYYHNITPAKYFFDMPQDKKMAELGRKQLIELKDCTHLAICVSKYNENELKEIGYKNTCVIPIPHRINELLKYKVDKEKSNITKFITVGRIARHKCIEDVIKTFNEYLKLNNKSQLYIIGSCSNSKYEKELINLINELNIKNKIVFASSISEKQLAYYYSNADAYICMSEHEGFCVPVIEASAFSLPIFSINNPAVNETLESTNIILSKNYQENAKTIANNLKNKPEQMLNVLVKYNNNDNLNLFINKILL